MAYLYCPTCKEKRMFKRHFTIATFIAFLLTLGLWVLVMPFYPKRCVVCGYRYSWLPEIQSRKWRIALGIVITLFALPIIVPMIAGHKSVPSSPTPSQVTRVESGSASPSVASIPKDKPAKKDEEVLKEARAFLTELRSHMRQYYPRKDQLERLQRYILALAGSEIILRDSQLPADKAKCAQIKALLAEARPLYRQAMAMKMEEIMLDKWHNMEVRAIGQNKDILQIKWPLINKAFVYKFCQNAGDMDALKAAGFKEIRFVGSFDREWTVKVTGK